MKVPSLALFIAGCVILIAAFSISQTEWWQSSADHIVITWTFVGILGAAVALLAVNSASGKGKQRWTAAIMITVLLLGFSILTLFSLGWILLPVALLLGGFSLWKLVHLKSEFRVH